MANSEKPVKHPMPPRHKRYLAALGIAAVTGALIGLWRRMIAPDGPNTAHLLLSDSSLSAHFAIGASALWLIGMAIGMLFIHRAVDDHEEHALLWAGLAAWYVFAFTAPIWWVLHRASIVPVPDVMLIFLLALAVNCIVWLWRKYR